MTAFTFDATFDGAQRGFKLVRATADDYPDMLDLVPKVTRCNKKHTGDELKAQFCSGSRYYPFIVREDNEGGKCVGYAAVYTMSHLGRPDNARLEHVVVHPDYRGHHIATHLVNYAIKFTKEELNCDRIDLTVENPIARHIYQQIGFKKIETEVLRLDL